LSGLVARRAADRLRTGRSQQLRHLRHQRGWKRTAEPDPERIIRKSPGLVARRNKDRLCEVSATDTENAPTPIHQPRPLRHERRWERPAATGGRLAGVLVARRPQ